MTSKSRRVKDEFRYQRVDLVRPDSSSEDEDDLDKVLGPSSRSTGSKQRKLSKCCSIFTVLLAIGALVSVVLFGTVIFPGSIQDALTRGRSWFGLQVDDENLFNATSNATNDFDDFNETSYTTIFPDYELMSSTLKIDESSSTNDYLYTTPKNDSELAEEKKSYNSRAIDPELAISNEERKSQYSDDPDFKPSFFLDESNFDNDPRDPDFRQSESESSSQLNEEFFYARKNRGMIDPDYDVQSDSYSNEEEETDYYPDPIPSLEDLEKSAEESNLITRKLLSTSTTTSSTISQDEIEVQELVNSTAVPDIDITDTEEEDNPKDIFDNLENSWPKTVWVKYKDDEAVMVAALICSFALTIVAVIGCWYCRRKKIERAKKKHFARLVSDLNATEKFTLVTPSDDEATDYE